MTQVEIHGGAGDGGASLWTRFHTRNHLLSWLWPKSAQISVTLSALSFSFEGHVSTTEVRHVSQPECADQVSHHRRLLKRVGRQCTGPSGHEYQPKSTRRLQWPTGVVGQVLPQLTVDTGGKGTLTQWVHCEFVVSFEAIRTVITQQVGGEFF